MSRWPLAGGLVLLLALALPVVAQTPSRPAQRPAAPPAQQPATPPQPEAQPAPYEADLLKLSEILGSLALLRQICDGPEKDIWAQRMRALLETEGRSQAIRDRLAGAFNEGFRSYALLHRSCLPSSQEAARRLARDGEILSRNLAARYGG